MKLSTLFRAYCDTRTLMSSIESWRGFRGIAIDGDKDAVEWQRRNRLSNTLKIEIKRRIAVLEAVQS